MNRRDFFKITGAISGAMVAGEALASEHKLPLDDSKIIGVLVDTTTCIGCRKCEWACNQANALPAGDIKSFEDKSVFSLHRRPTDSAYTVINAIAVPGTPEKPHYMKVQCMHCNEPACVSACIVGALRKTELGPVIYDAWKCMGCRYCMIACPFQVPAYEYNDAFAPRVVKCSFCFDRISKESKRPACVEICPNEALTFGTRRELLDLARTRINQSPERYTDHVYGEHEVGGASWLYLAGVDFQKTELPKLDDRPIPERTEKIQHAVFKSFVPPLALFGLLALAMHSFKNRRSDGGNHERS
jgi:Fe-S-cluster-containing dehydrogenase component